MEFELPVDEGIEADMDECYFYSFYRTRAGYVCQQCWPDHAQPEGTEHAQHLTHWVGRIRPPKPKCAFCERHVYLVMKRDKCVVCR